MADIRRYTDSEELIPGKPTEWWREPARQRRVNRLLRGLEAGKLSVDVITGVGVPVPIVLVLATRTVTGDTALSKTDGIVYADASLGEIILALPQASVNDGLCISVKKTDQTRNPVSVVTAYGESVEGGDEAAITVPGTSLVFASDSANWYVV